jgi:hypothetical protein
MWHERSTSSPVDNYQHRHLGQQYAYFAERHLITDYRYPRILHMSSNYFDDAGSPIVSDRIAPILFDRHETNGVFVHKLVVDIEGGVGRDTVTAASLFRWLADGTHLASERLDTSGEGLVPDHNAVPVAWLSWSADSGHTWSNSYPAQLGKRGEYRRRLVWTRLGKARNRVFRLRMSDGVKKIVLGSYVNDGGM